MSDRVTDPRLYAVLARLVATGFAVDVDTDRQRLKVTPSRLLTTAQRDWIKANLSALVLAVATPVERWCIEYPRSLATADSGTRCVVDYLPMVDWRTVARGYPGATVWPAPAGLGVAKWISEGMPILDSAESMRGEIAA